MPSRDPPRLPPLPVLFAGVLGTSFSAILIRLAQNEAPSLVIATGRLGTATLILLPWLVRRKGKELPELPPGGWRLALVSGVMLGLHFAAYIAALNHTTIAAATVLATSTPIWVGLAAPIFLQEPLLPSLKAGIGLAVVGSMLIGLAEGGSGSRSLLGNGLALASALTGAVYFLIGRRLRPHLSLLEYTTVIYGMGALTLLAMTWIGGYRLLGYSPIVYFLFLLMAIFPQLLGHSSYNYALAYLPAAYVSVAIISEPIGASILGLLFFGEMPGPFTLVGGALILTGIFLAGRRAGAS